MAKNIPALKKRLRILKIKKKKVILKRKELLEKIKQLKTKNEIKKNKIERKKDDIKLLSREIPISSKGFKQIYDTNNLKLRKISKFLEKSDKEISEVSIKIRNNKHLVNKLDEEIKLNKAMIQEKYIEVQNQEILNNKIANSFQEKMNYVVETKEELQEKKYKYNRGEEENSLELYKSEDFEHDYLEVFSREKELDIFLRPNSKIDKVFLGKLLKENGYKINKFELA